jgi:hypothetical protein
MKLIFNVELSLVGVLKGAKIEKSFGNSNSFIGRYLGIWSLNILGLLMSFYDNLNCPGLLL